MDAATGRPPWRGLINNKGNLGQTLSDLGSDETIRNVATAMLTAGALNALAGSISVPNADGKLVTLAEVSGKSDLVAQIGKNIINNATSAVIDTAVNGGDLGDKLAQAITTSVIDAAGASAANSVGDLEGFSNRMGHLVVGCALGAAKGGDCGAGAIGGLAGELAAEWFGGNREPVSATQASKTVDVARLFGALAATLVGGDAQVGASAAGNAAQNNWLNHLRPSPWALSEKERYDAASAGCAKGDSQACTELRNLLKLSAQRDQNLASACAGGEGCITAVNEARAAGNQVVVGADGKVYALPRNYQLFYDSQGRVVSAVPADTPQLKAPERAGNTWQNAVGQGMAEFVLIDGAGLLGSALIKGGGLLFGAVTKAVGGAEETVSALGLVATGGAERTTVIGRVKDLQSLAPGEISLLDRLPYLNDIKANWYQNAGVLREEMRYGRPIRDASYGDVQGIFLNAERNLLKSHGWSFDAQTKYWMPPKP
ncbi:DUF637 domain-containing protein [Zoogloea sp.]|uniref:DUF637 domain-containing protein n=1 Tax=Zoogloea sp. TaxID=49181 RepID=UPI00345C4E18